MTKRDVTPEKLFETYSLYRIAQSIITDLAYAQADLALATEPNNLDIGEALEITEDTLKEIIDFYHDALKEMQKHSRQIAASGKKEKAKRTKVTGNVIQLKTKPKRKPKT